MRRHYEETGWREYRYVVCGDCGEIYNIALTQDTSHGYLCPDCTRKRRKLRDSKERKSADRFRAADAGMAPAGGGGQRAESRTEGKD